MIFFLFHAVYSTTLAFFLASLFGAMSPAIAGVSLVLGSWLASRHARNILMRQPGLRVRSFSGGEVGAIEGLLCIVILYACVRHFAWLLFPTDGKWLTLSANNFGDLPLHINYIRSLASRMHFPILDPSYASEPLRYPFGPDLYDALWECLGVPLRSHLFLVGVLTSVCSLVILRWFGSWWAIGAFFLSGGILGFTKIAPGIDPQALVDWKNLLLSVFITQRGILFALPAGILLMDLWRKHVSGESVLDRQGLTAVGLLWGFLPLFHAHAFIAVSIVMLGLSLIEKGKDGFKALFLSRAFAFAVLPAVLFVWRTTDGFKQSSVSRWDPWWTSTTAEAPRFIWINFGFWAFLPVVIAAVLYVKHKGDKKLWWRLALSFGLFALWFNWMLAPWSWDNIKLLIWPYLMLAQLAYVTIDPKLPRFSRYVVATLLFASGFTAVSMSLGVPGARGLTIYQMKDLNYAEGALRAVPDMNAKFVAAPTHEHPLTYFGRLRVMGYEGHLWSHGIDSSPVRDKVDGIFNGSPEWLKFARDLGVDYIYWGVPEKAKYGDSPKPWMTELTNVSTVPEVGLYRLPPAGGEKK